MLEAGALLAAILGGGVIGGRFAESRFGPKSNHELPLIASGAALGTIVAAMGIFMLPL